ncbi:MAG TPA: RsmE family RNA methyltransferase [Cellvibrionaceae bacterium]
MNILLLNEHQFLSPNRAIIKGRQLAHLQEVLKVSPGKIINIGIKNSFLSQAIIESITKEYAELQLLESWLEPPPTLPCTLILGLPRPRMLQRSLQTIATMGVQHLILIASERVEKSFWQTPLLKPDAINEQLELGLEQAKATQIPLVSLCPNWREFSQTLLPTLCKNHVNKVFAHPGCALQAASLPPGESLVAVGPEGGFVHDEIAAFLQNGFSQVHLGERILRVETAIPVLLAKLF